MVSPSGSGSVRNSVKICTLNICLARLMLIGCSVNRAQGNFLEELEPVPIFATGDGICCVVRQSQLRCRTKTRVEIIDVNGQ